MSEHIVLFDMDGTLTPARKPITSGVLHAIRKLTRFRRSKVGIVTGSGLDYLVEQCNPIWTEIGASHAADVVLMPCNGTQVYKWDKNIRTFAESHSACMAKKLRKKKYKKLVSELLSMQLSLLTDHDIPLTGEFISYRKSLVNWCPIGRSAGDEERAAFIEYDNSIDLRSTYLEKLIEFCTANKINVTCALGGQTSIDIYPTGWDKSYALGQVGDATCWFVGDKCTGTGNDKQIYDALVKTGRAFQTTGPEETVDIIMNKIIPSMEEIA